MSRPIHDQLPETVREAAKKLRVLADEEVSRRPGEKKWSKKEILGHLIDSAANDHQRFVRAQYYEVLDLPGYDQ